MKLLNTCSIALASLFLLSSLPLFAQHSNPCIPIDGGISALLAVGASYGIKKLYDNKKK